MEQILLSSRELERYGMVQDRLKKGHKIEDILQDYGVSRRTFYVNLHKFEARGINGLKSKWGEHRRISSNIEQEFKLLFKKHPYFSSYEFSEIIDLNPRTIQRIIIRRNLVKVSKAKKERRKILEELKKNLNLKKNTGSKEKKLQRKRNKK